MLSQTTHRSPRPVRPRDRFLVFGSPLIGEERARISRDGFLRALTAHNIGIGVHYLSVPEHAYYQKAFGWRPQDYPHAMRIGRQTGSLPLSAKLTEGDVQDVIRAVQRVPLEEA